MSITLRFITICLCGFPMALFAGPAEVRDEVTTAADLAKYTALATDDDWLSGVWCSDTDAANQLYTLFEESGDAYTATHYCRRYSITWWTVRVEKGEDHIRIWNYTLSGNQLRVAELPTSIYSHANGRLVSTNGSMHPVTDAADLARLSKVPFTTGRAHLEGRIAIRRQLRQVTGHADLLIGSSALLAKAPSLNELGVVAEDSQADAVYLLTRVVLADPPHSGPNGAMSWNGYYWVHLSRRPETDRWGIKDEWLVTASQDLGTSVRLEQGDDGYLFIREELLSGKVLDTYTMTKPGIRQRPILLAE